MPRHDQLFKRIFKDPRRAANALSTILPSEVAAAIDWATLAVVPGSFVTKALRHRHSDLLYSVNINGQTAYIHVLFEHQSTPHPLMPYRVVGYSVGVWDVILRRHPNARKLPALLPVVVYNGRRPWTAPTRLSELYDLDAETLEVLRPCLLDGGFVLQDLVVTDDDWLRTRLSAVVAFVLGCLKHSRNAEALGQWWESNQPMLRAVFTQAEFEALDALIQYAFSANMPTDRVTRVAEQIGADAEEAVMTVLDKLIEKGHEQGHKQGFEQGLEQGREQGLEQGLEQGREQGREQGVEQGSARRERKLIEQLIGMRFGPVVDDALRARIDDLDASQIEAINVRLMSPSYTPIALDTLFNEAEPG